MTGSQTTTTTTMTQRFALRVDRKLYWAAAVAVCLAVAARFHLHILTAAAFAGAITETWAYHESAWYLAYLQSQWSQLPEVAPTAIPEIHVDNFTQELFWQLTDNLRKPVVIRDAIKNSTAFKAWGRDFFVGHYPDELVLVREMLDETQFRIEQISFKDFWAAYEQGRNVTVFTSSNIFSTRPELFDQVSTPFEDQLTDQNGNGIFLSQLFITPGGRSFLHSEVGGNIFRQVAGRKAWTLISPEYNLWLCPFLVGEFVAVQTCVQRFEPELREQWFKRIPRTTAVLEAGDVLYNPPWYWHDIVTLDASRRQTSISGRLKLKTQSMQNSWVQSLWIIRKQLRLRAKVHALTAKRGSSKVDVNSAFEELIAIAWTEGCLAEGRDDCDSTLKVASGDASNIQQ